MSTLSDIYSIGAILYKLLIGNPPDIEISDHITKKRMWDKSPDQNVFNVPYFFEKCILSNDMCYIVSKLLCGLPKYRYLSLSSLKKDLMKLKENIYSTPSLLRRVLSHPVMPQENLTSNKKPLPKLVDFKNQKMNEFSLKYLAKFIYENNVE